jgi:hypothetical protein
MDIDMNTDNKLATTSNGLLRTGVFTALCLAATWVLSGCQGGASTVANPGSGSGGGALVSVGGVPQSDLVQAFKIEMWPNLSEQCGNCHIQDGQSPSFARTDDINSAYNQAITVTNMMSPQDSRLVSKVASGHQCWLTTNSACADVMTRWIENWLAATGAVPAGRDIVLVDVEPVNPGGGKSFPSSSTSFEDLIWDPILVPNCSGCHDPATTVPQSPFFANAADVNTSYDAAKPEINLDTPALSDFVTKVAGGHNCWVPDGTGGFDCDLSADAMLQAIIAFAAPLTAANEVTAPNASGGVTLEDATLASGGNRYESAQIALYEFKNGQENPASIVVDDRSGVSPAMPLELSGNVNWVGGYGIEFTDATAEARAADASKLRRKIALGNPTDPPASGEYSIEAWVIPANVTQEEANIISYSGNSALRNFTLGQTMYNYDFMHNSSTTGIEGTPATSTPDADEVLQSSLQHVVATFDPVNGRRIYVNGQVTNAMDPAPPGTLDNWNDSFSFILGNEIGNDKRPWKGIIKLAAIHDRALSHEQIVQNFEVGVGEKYFMLFPIGHIPGVENDSDPANTNSYIMFEFSQIDAYGYLLHSPTFVYTGADVDYVPDFQIAGMRIGINGTLLTDGQAYSNMNLMVGVQNADYDTDADMQLLNRIGTVLPVQNGVDTDEFYLMFDIIGTENSNPYVEPTFTPQALTSPPEQFDMGIRVFSEINAAFSEMTGVPITNQAVSDVYEVYEQQLPTVENIDGFLGSHQMAIAQMALAYCDELVENRGSIPRDTYFSGFSGFGQGPSSALDTQGERNAMLDPLLTAALNWEQGVGDLTSQPDNTLVRSMVSSQNTQDLDTTLPVPANQQEYTSLIQDMIDRCPGCNNDPARTAEIVKATCAATLGSAVMLIQ